MEMLLRRKRQTVRNLDDAPGLKRSPPSEEGYSAELEVALFWTGLLSITLF